jgi:carboxymethylenebutenolidase
MLAPVLLLVLAGACAGRGPQRTMQSTATMPAATVTCREASYASGDATIRATLCVPTGEDEELPAVLVLHGCGGPSPALEAEVGRGLAEQGFVTLSVAYFGGTRAPGRVTGNWCALQDVSEAALLKAAAAWSRHLADGISVLQAQPRVGRDRIGVVGWSTGGAVALGTAVLDPRLRAAVVYAGALPEILRPRVGALPPVLILHGDADDEIDVAQAYALRDALTAAGRPHDLHVYPGGSHRFWNEREAADARARTTAFLRQQLSP